MQSCAINDNRTNPSIFVSSCLHVVSSCLHILVKLSSFCQLVLILCQVVFIFLSSCFHFVSSCLHFYQVVFILCQIVFILSCYLHFEVILIFNEILNPSKFVSIDPVCVCLTLSEGISSCRLHTTHHTTTHDLHTTHHTQLQYQDNFYQGFNFTQLYTILFDFVQTLLNFYDINRNFPNLKQ